MREPLSYVGRRADGRVFNVLYPASLQLRQHSRIQIEVQGSVRLTSHDRGLRRARRRDEIDYLLPDTILTRADTRSDPGP